MTRLPRIAVGTVQPGADHHVMTWALLQTLVNRGLRPQPFYAQGRFSARDAATTITGLPRRYLDSWLMKRGICIELFKHGSQFSDLALVEGSFDAARDDGCRGGSLDRLCCYLDLPKLIIVDAARMTTGCVPRIPDQTDGILLDNIVDTTHMCHLQTTLETLYGVPVVGSLGQLRCLRAAIMGAPRGATPTRELCAALGRALQRRLQLGKILRMASARAFPAAASEPTTWSANRPERKLHVAVALDEAFTCYFPDTLDVLEERGATVSVFSPLTSEQLPNGCDVLYFGCGRPEEFADQLSGNICIREAVWNHVVTGGRIYAESAGMAYLAREIELPNGATRPTVGVLPSSVRFDPAAGVSTPATLRVAADCWLFGRDQHARGYLNRRWCLQDDRDLLTLASDPRQRLDLVGNYQVVASRLHLHFASQPALVQRFFQPTRPTRLPAIR